ncbi:MAG: hypothetical protein ACYCT2_04775 [Thermoplasmataceae archaeon]
MSSLATFAISVITEILTGLLTLINSSVTSIMTSSFTLLGNVFYGWFTQLSEYGPWIPVFLAGGIGVAGAGLYVVFIFSTAAEDVIP